MAVLRGSSDFADVEARMPLLLEQHDVAAALGQQGRGGAAAGSAADDQDFALARLVGHAMPPLMEIAWPVM